MEKYEIETLLTLAEELHFGRTAERLMISPGRVTQIIQKLERRVGAQLFERTTRQVCLTPVGSQLRDDLQPHWIAIQRALERAAAAAHGQEGTLIVGFIGPGAHELADATAAFRVQHPRCDLHFYELQITNPFGGMRSGKVDVALVWLPVTEPDLSVGRSLLETPLLLALPENDPLASHDSISIEDLGDRTVFDVPDDAPGHWLDLLPHKTPSGRPIVRGPKVRDTPQAMLADIAVGRALSAIPSVAAKYYNWPGLAYRPIRDLAPRDWALVWNSNRESQLVRSFVDIAHDVMAPNTASSQPVEDKAS